MKHLRKGLLFTLVLISASFLFGSSALALTSVPDDLFIDFRDSDWDAADGQHSFTVTYDFGYGPEDVTAEAFRVNPNTGFQEAALFQDNTDGLGIRGGEEDEINYLELLKVYFENPVYLSTLGVTDLFGPSDGVGGESGQATLFDEDGISMTIQYDGDSPPPNVNNGEFVAYLGGNRIVRAEFEIFGGATNNEHSIAGFTGSAVPEPATMFLLGLGLIGLGAVGRKKGLFAKKA